MSGLKPSSVPPWAQCAGYVVLTLVFAVATVAVGYFLHELRTNGIETSAVIVDDAGVLADDVIVEFRTLEGATVRARVPDTEVSGTDVGDTVRIRYLPNDPSIIMGAGRAAVAMNIFFLVTFGVLTAVAAGTAYRRLRHRPSS